MIQDLKVQSVAVAEGVLQASIQLKTEHGQVAMQVAFELKKNPGLDALIPLIDAEVRKAAANVGLIPAKEPATA